MSGLDTQDRSTRPKCLRACVQRIFGTASQVSALSSHLTTWSWAQRVLSVYSSSTVLSSYTVAVPLYAVHYSCNLGAEWTEDH